MLGCPPLLLPDVRAAVGVIVFPLQMAFLNPATIDEILTSPPMPAANNAFEMVLAKITKAADLHTGSQDRAIILSALMLLAFSEDPRVG